MSLQLDSIDEALAEISAGRPVVVVDDEDRENEGDLIMAADAATPEWVGFMVRHTGGVLCVPMPRADARRLQLHPMVSENDAPLATAFTVSVDVREGLSTGISALERSNTVRALADRARTADDFVRPGHIFPLIARDGGVLMRTGHTEAAVDLARLAGQTPIALISEIVHDDGSIQRGPDLEVFAKEHDLKIVSIDDLIAYRQARESLVSRVSDEEIATSIGSARAVVYETTFDQAQHVAVVFGDISDGRNVLTRFQREETVADVFHPDASPIAAALKRIEKEGRGIVVYLRHGAAGVVTQSDAGAAPTDGTGDGAASDAARHAQWREVGLGAQILKDLGIHSIRVLSTTERQYFGLSGFSVEIAGTELI
ncbi:MAG: 3,4-dihydroxy-2-butanone-4-phosphate synthase [Pseudomonadota bacterium]